MKSFDQQVQELNKDWETNPRWKLVKRGYKAEDVVRLRGSLQPEYTLAKRGAEKLWEKVNGTAKKGYVNAFGAITAGQAMQHQNNPAVGVEWLHQINAGFVQCFTATNQRQQTFLCEARPGQPQAIS